MDLSLFGAVTRDGGRAGVFLQGGPILWKEGTMDLRETVDAYWDWWLERHGASHSPRRATGSGFDDDSLLSPNFVRMGLGCSQVAVSIVGTNSDEESHPHHTRQTT